MKVKVNRVLSVVLSLILVFSCVLPAFQFATSAAGEDAAITAIKDAWAGVEVTGSPEVYGDEFYYKDSGSWKKYPTTANITTKDFDGINLKVAAPADAANGSFIVMPTSAGAVGTTDKMININDYESIYFYYKAPNGYAGLQLGACPNTGGVNLAAEFTLPATAGEEYAKFDVLTALKNSEKVGAFDGTGSFDGTKRWFAGRVHFGNGGVALTDIAVSQLVFSKKPAGICPEDDETKDWKLYDWYKAAKEVDLSVIIGKDAEKETFNNAIANAYDVLMSTDEGKIALIKGAMQELEWEAEPVMTTYLDKTTGNWAEYTANSSVETIDDQEISVIDAKDTVGGLILISPPTDTNGPQGKPSKFFNTNDYEEMYFYYKATDTVKYQLACADKTTGNMTSWSGLTLNAINQFTKVDIYDLMVNGAHPDYFNGESVGRMLFRVHFDTKFTALTVSQVYAKACFNVEFGIDEEESKNWDLSKWLQIASNVDLEKYGNTAPLENVLASFKIDPAIQVIKDAWSALKLKKEIEIFSDGFYAQTSSNKNWHEYATAANITTKEFDGLNLKVATPNDTTTFITMPSGATPVGTTSRMLNVNDYEEVYFYYKSAGGVNSVQFGACENNGGINDAKNSNLPATTGEEYAKFDVLAFLKGAAVVGNFDGSGNTRDGKPRWFAGRVHFSSATPDLSISQVVAVKKQPSTLPGASESVTWTLGDWYFAADQLDLDRFEDGPEKETFKQVIAESKQLLLATDDGKIALIKALWTKFEIPATPVFDKWYDKTSGVWAINTNAPGSKTMTIDGADYPVVEPNGVAGGFINMGLWDGNNINKTTTPIDIDNYTDMFFYYKSSDKLYSVQLAYCGKDGGVSSAKQAEWDASPDEFTRVDIKKHFIDKMQTNLYNGTEYYFMRMHFGGTQPNGATMTPIMGVKTWEHEFGINLEETKDWTVSDWIVNASSHDFSKYGNSEELAVLIEDLASMDMNLIGHAPVEAYRTDADGTHTPVDESEFGIEDTALMYDNDLENAVTVTRNGKTLDIIYNLSKIMKINEVGLSTLTPNIKGYKVYAANVKAAIWEENSFLCEFKAEDGAQLSTDAMIQRFSTPAQMRYIRFSITDTVNDAVDLTEIHVRGQRRQELLYKNLATNEQTVISTVLQDKSTYDYTALAYDSNRFGANQRKLSFNNLTDKNVNTVYDFMMGSKNKESFNLLFDLGRSFNVDKIMLNCGSEDYFFPTAMNFYIGDSDAGVFAKDAKKVYSYDAATETGLYEASFNPVTGQYVRIEILDNDCEYYNDYIMTVISELGVYGIDLTGTVSGDAVATFEDSATGIITDIIARSGNDIFEEVNNAKVVGREPTAAEKASAESYGMSFVDKIYTVTLLDYKGNPMTDVGGRSVRISVPIPEGLDMNTAFWGTVNNGKFSALDHSVELIGNKWYLTYEFTNLNELIVGVAKFNEYVEEVPEEEVFEEEVFEEMTEEVEIPVIEDEEEEETTVTKPERVKKYYKVKKPGGDGLPIGAIIGIVVGSVVLAAGIALLIIILIKKKKNKQA